MGVVSKVKSIIKNNTGALFYARQSFSQEGEDLVLSRFFDGQESGFYIEVGAHHPFRFSNTYLFTKRLVGDMR